MNQSCLAKAVSIKYYTWASIITSVIRYAKRMRRIILPQVLSRSTILFPALFHKRHDFREKVTEYKICVLIFSTTFV